VKQADVRKAIEKLPDAYREVIVLREFEELSYERIAQILDCPSGTVMSRLSRARERLREMLNHCSLTTDGAAKEAGGGSESFSSMRPTVGRRSATFRMGTPDAYPVSATPVPIRDHRLGVPQYQRSS
jgi:predicted DNA-binding protein (UPF0251 family)